MRKTVLAIALAGTFGIAAPALAGPGQCYDAYGRPVGPVYDTDHPNYGFLESVKRRGGTCTGDVARPNYRDRRDGYRQDRNRYRQGRDGYRQGRDRLDTFRPGFDTGTGVHSNNPRSR